MSTPMISVQGISKQYRIQAGKRVDLRAGLFSNLKKVFAPHGEPFWALRDISFDVAEGEALGIIGRNGAGKSTLLKLLSRITTPTEGRFEINGRVSSLLEVGTGFHPELSGKENIYLNGTILGMRRAEVKRKFDEIVAFSGVERFLENPVKQYSSGQKVRLAFAVAAHLEPEVLIIDEVLAVGDADFQRKCLGKMKDVAKSGRTVLFVSHNMSAINSLCERCILLDQGRVEVIGATPQVVAAYLSGDTAMSDGHIDLTHLPLSGDKSTRLTHVRWTDANGELLSSAQVTQDVKLEIGYEALTEGIRPQPVVFVYNSAGEHVLTTFPGRRIPVGVGKGPHRASVHFPANFFNADTYYISLWLLTWAPHQVHLVQENVTRIQVMDDLESPTRSLSHYVIRGAVRPLLEWESELK